MTTKDEALKMAIEALLYGTDHTKAVLACKEALEQPLTRDWKETVNERKAKDIEFAKALEQQEQEPVAWMRSALDNARDVCKYLDHDMIKEAKAHTKFFWNDIDKIKEHDTHPAKQLSDDEIMQEVKKHDYYSLSFKAGVRWAEAKIRGE